MARKSRSVGKASRTEPRRPTVARPPRIRSASSLPSSTPSANVRTGDIVFHLSGAGAGEFCLLSRPGRTTLSPTGRGPEDRKPFRSSSGGTPTSSASILSGEKNALKQSWSEASASAATCVTSATSPSSSASSTRHSELAESLRPLTRGGVSWRRPVVSSRDSRYSPTRSPASRSVQPRTIPKSS